MKTGNGNDGSQGSQDRDIFGTGPDAGAAPGNPGDLTPEVVPGKKSFYEENKYQIGSGILIIILLLLLVFLGGLLFGKNKNIEKATAELNNATAVFAQAVSETTNHDEGTVILNTLKANEGGFKGFIVEVFTSLCADYPKFCMDDKQVVNKVYLSGAQAQLIADAVAGHVQQGGNPEELQKLRGVNGDLATTTGRQQKMITDLEKANAVLAEKLKHQPVAQPVTPVVDPAAAERDEKLAAEAKARAEKLDKKLDKVLEVGNSLAQGQKLSKDQMDKLIAESKDIAGQKEAEEKAKTCPAGTSVPLIKSDKGFKWYIVMNPDEYAELKAASKEDRDGIEAKYSGRADVLLESVFIPVCISIGEHYLLLDQEDGTSVVTLTWDGTDLKSASLNHRIMVMFLFAKGGPVIETLGDQNIDMEMGTDYPLLKGRGE